MMTRKMLTVTILLSVLPLAAGAGDAQPRRGRLLFLIAEGVNGHEFMVPYEVGRAAGYEFDLAGPAKVTLLERNAQRGAPVAPVNLLLDDVKDISPYAGLIIPGGGSPANLVLHPRSMEICRMFVKADAPILAMCHGPRLLIKAGVMKGRVFTCLPRVADELADEWKSRDCGLFVDRATVIDGPVLTSPHFHYGKDYCRAMLELFEQNGGIPVARRPAHVVVVAAGTPFSGHAKWAMTDVPGIVWTRVSLLEKAASIKTFLETPDPSLPPPEALYVLPGKDLEPTIKDEAFAALAAKVRALKAPIVGVNAAFEKMKGAGVECVQETVAGEAYPAYVRLIVKRAQQSGRPPSPAPEQAAPEATAAIHLGEGFDDGQYAALRAFLDWREQSSTVVGAKRGWMRGRAGCPVWVERPAGPADDKAPYAFALARGGVELKRGAGDLGAAAAAFAKGAGGASDEGPFTAAIALREGFDDYACAAMRAALAWSGRKTVVLGPEKGDLAGLNGIVAKVSHGYAQAPDLAAGSIVVLPGGLYPDKVEQAQQAEQPKWLDQQAERDALRMKWVMDAYAKGATVVVLGYDGSRMAALDACKGLSFACPVHAGSKFAGKPGKITWSDPALKTQDRMYSAQGPAALGDLLRLLEKNGLIATMGQKGR
jgi:protease I